MQRRNSLQFLRHVTSQVIFPVMQSVGPGIIICRRLMILSEQRQVSFIPFTSQEMYRTETVLYHCKQKIDEREYVHGNCFHAAQMLVQKCQQHLYVLWNTGGMAITWGNFFLWLRTEDLNAETSDKMKTIKINFKAPLCLIRDKKLPSFSTSVIQLTSVQAF